MSLKKIIKEIFWWGIYLAFLAGVVWGTPKALAYILKTPYPMASITSGSMWPSLKRGDFILIKGIKDINEIKTGDIVVYQNSPSAGSGPAEGFTIHRVVKINGEMITTRGDANNVDDAPVRFDKIVGKPLTVSGNKPLRIPVLGMVSVWLNKQSFQ